MENYKVPSEYLKLQFQLYAGLIHIKLQIQQNFELNMLENDHE